jgi:polyhydroxyalkanoate synthesis regulator phasin
LFATAAALLCAGAAFAQDSGALIDLLVKKGVLNDQEAEELRAELTKDFAANTSAGKMNLGSAITDFKISGDVRIRDQYETQAPETASGNPVVSNERNRVRYRLRFNTDVMLQKGWGAGFALETGQAADSGNQTFQDLNDDYAIFLAKVYIQWQINQNWLLVAGKQKNPLYTTDLGWDADINPQGFHEGFKHFLGTKDTFEVRAMQVKMDDRNESIAGPNGRDAYRFDGQLVYTKWFGKDNLNSVILAPGYFTYNDSVVDGGTNENPFTGSTRGFSNIIFAGEVNWANVAGASTSFKVYWDSNYNLESARRVYSIYGISKAFDDDPLAWLVGIGYGYGTGKVQGDYSFKLDYRQIGIGSVDPNTSDSDFAFGKLNQEGWKFSATYNIADFANLTATYFYTEAIQDKLTNPIANLDHSQTVQIDLNVKF